MPRGDGGWYPVALDCAPFRFPAPNSKTKSHSTFPVENATWLTWLTKFDYEKFKGTCFFFLKIVGLVQMNLFFKLCWDLKFFLRVSLVVFLCPKDFMYIYKIDDALKDWRVEGLANLGILASCTCN